MRKAHGKLVSLFAMAMVAVVLLSACGTAASSTVNSEASSAPIASSVPPSSSVAPASVPLDIPSQQLTVGTASAGGAFFPIGTGIAEVISQHVEPLMVTAEITGGSIENPRLVGDNEVDMGISNGNQAVDGYEGNEPFEKAYDIRGISSLHASVLHLVTLENSGVNSVEDMKGKRVAVGPVGGGSVPILEAVFAEYGMTMDDITPSYVSYEDGMTQLKDGQVAVALVAAGYPAAAVLGLSATDKVKLISVESDKMDALCAKHPYYTPITLPKEMYNTTDSAVVVGVRNVLYCNPDLSEDTVYAITKALYENLDELKTYHSALEDIQQENMPDVAGLPLHPGAERFYKEVGLL